MKLPAAEVCRRWRQRHPGQAAANCRKSYHSNLGKNRESGRQRKQKQYLLRREEILERNRQWRSANPDKIRIRDAKRRAILKTATVNLESVEAWMASVLRKRSFVCYHCRKRFPKSELHFDHIVALATGGLHCVENLCCSCAPCNLSKGAKSISAWIKSGQQILPI